MGTRLRNTGPGAMTGVSQIQATMTFSKPVGPSSQQVRRTHPRRAAGTTPEVPLHRGQMFRAWASLTHPYVRMCFNELTKRLFGGSGIVVYRGDRPSPPSEQFQTVLQRDFVPFDRDAIDAIMAFGVVPIAFRRIIGGGLGESDVVPYVPKYGTYVITTWTEAGLQRFRFYWSGAITGDYGNPPPALSGTAHWTGGGGPFGDRDDTVVVAHDFGYDPNVDGSLTSNLHAIAQQLSVVGELTRLAVTAERIAANPPLVTAYNPAIEDQAVDKYGENFFVGQQDRCTDRAEAVYQRTAQQQAVFREQMELWEQATGMSASEEFRDDEGKPIVARRRGDGTPEGAIPPPWARDWRGHEMPWAREYYLSPTRQMVQHQLPRPRTDLVDLSEQAMSIVCGVLNVPRGMLASDSHVRAGVEAVAEAMHRTVNRWADVVGTLMTAVYSHTFGHKDLRDELRIRMERKRRGPFDRAASLLTEADLFAADAKTRVRLAFDLPPSTTPERLDALYNRGMLNWETYATAQLRLHNFGRDQLPTRHDPLTKQEQRQLLLGPPPPDPPTGGGGSGIKRKSPSSSSSSTK